MRERLRTATVALLLLICPEMADAAVRIVAVAAASAPRIASTEIPGPVEPGLSDQWSTAGLMTAVAWTPVGAPSATVRGLAAMNRVDNPSTAERAAAKTAAVAAMTIRHDAVGPVDGYAIAHGRTAVTSLDGCAVTAAPEATTADLRPRSRGTRSGAAADTAKAGELTATDLARAHHACRMARARFAELFGQPVPGVRILLWDRPGYRTGTGGGGAMIFWPNSRAMAERAAAAGAGAPAHYIDDQWRNVLPHETMHALLAARFPAQEGTGTGMPDGYGTPLPDWLEEGVAIWGESAKNRRARLAQARTLPASRRNLSSILAASHPAAGTPEAAAIRRGAAPPPDEALWTFYPQAIAVVAFLYDAGGREALRELVRRLITGSRTPAGAVSGLPGLPADFDDVVALWNAWLAGG